MKYTLDQLNEMMSKNGGWLDLRGTSITSLPEGLTVGGWLDLSGTSITDANNVRGLKNGDYQDGKYLFADNILTHVKKKKKFGKYTFFFGKIPGRNVVFDGKNYAHCNKIRDGISDLLFKEAEDRGADQYKGLSIDTEMALKDIVAMYRVITGACKQGSQEFVDSLGDKKKERYTIREAIELTQGQYNSEKFKEFFDENDL